MQDCGEALLPNTVRKGLRGPQTSPQPSQIGWDGHRDVLLPSPRWETEARPGQEGQNFGGLWLLPTLLGPSFAKLGTGPSLLLKGPPHTQAWVWQESWREAAAVAMGSKDDTSWLGWGVHVCRKRGGLDPSHRAPAYCEAVCYPSSSPVFPGLCCPLLLQPEETLWGWLGQGVRGKDRS